MEVGHIQLASRLNGFDCSWLFGRKCEFPRRLQAGCRHLPKSIHTEPASASGQEQLASFTLIQLKKELSA